MTNGETIILFLNFVGYFFLDIAISCDMFMILQGNSEYIVCILFNRNIWAMGSSALKRNSQSLI